MDSAKPVVVKAAPSPKSPPKYPDFCGRRRLQLEVQILNREIGFLEEELQSIEGLQTVSRCCKEVEEFVGSNPDPLIPIDKKRHQSCRFWKWLRSVFCIPVTQLCCYCCCHCCCLKRSCCRDCSSQKDCFCSHCKCKCPCCPIGCPCRRCKCTTCSPCTSCLEPCCNISDSCSCSCFRFHLPSCRCRICSCGLSCCSFSPLRSCPSKTSCCRMPRCTACDLSPCMPWRWWCCSIPLCYCCCREASCSLPRPLCPDYSCGCIWSCPNCTEARLCRSCCSSKSSCITGCLC